MNLKKEKSKVLNKENLTKGLFSDAELSNDCSVTLDFFLMKIVKQASSFTYQLHQTKS